MSKDELSEILKKLLNSAIYESAENSNGLYPVSTYTVSDALKALTAIIEREKRETALAELKNIKQGHKQPYAAANAEILLNAIDDRIKALNDKENI